MRIRAIVMKIARADMACALRINGDLCREVSPSTSVDRGPGLCPQGDKPCNFRVSSLFKTVSAMTDLRA